MTDFGAEIRCLLEEDSFPRTGELLRSHPVLLTSAADQKLVELAGRAGHQPDGNRAEAIRQLRAFLSRCTRLGLDAVFPPGHPDIDPAVVAVVRADMDQADAAESAYDRSGDGGTLGVAAVAWRQVLAHPDLASAYPGLRAALLNNGRRLLLKRYWATGDLDDLRDALDALETAVALTPTRSDLMAGRLGNLGLVIREMYLRSGQQSMLDRALRTLEGAAATARHSSASQTALTNLALGLQDRYLRTGDARDLARAVAVSEQACETSPSLNAAVMLGDLLRRRHESTGAPGDLDRAVGLLRAAVQATPDGAPERPRRLVDLAIALLDQHSEGGDRDDLSASEALCEEAVRSVPPASPHRAGALVHRSITFYRRYESTGALDYLDRAIDGFDEAVASSPRHGVDTPGWRANLAAAVHERARRTGAPAEFDRAVALYEAVVADEPAGGVDRFAAVNNLANALRDRHHATGNGVDLDRAIDLLRTALRTAPEGSARSATLSANLGATHQDRYAISGSRSELDEAMARLLRAVEVTAPDDIDRPRRLFALALSSRDRYELTSDEADLATAASSYRAGCADGAVSDPSSTLMAAQEWGLWAGAHRSWSDAADAYDTAIGALLALVGSQVVREHKEDWLRRAAGLAGRAGRASVMARRLPAAVVALEQTRAAILGRCFSETRSTLRGWAAMTRISLPVTGAPPSACVSRKEHSRCCQRWANQP